MPTSLFTQTIFSPRGNWIPILFYSNGSYPEHFLLMKESDLVAGGLPGEEYCRGVLMKESDWLQVDYLARNIAAAY
jgi:hypothetical protein